MLARLGARLAPAVHSLRMASSAAYKNVEAPDAHTLVQGGALFLDVRTPEEFSEGSAAGAVNVPVQLKVEGKMQPNPEFLEKVQEHFPDKEAPIVCSCMFGRRGEGATKQLAEAGFANLSNVIGGLSSWKKAGLPAQGTINDAPHH